MYKAKDLLRGTLRMAITGGISRPTGGDYVRQFEEPIGDGSYSAELIEVEDCVIAPFKPGDEPKDGYWFKYDCKIDDGPLVRANRQIPKTLRMDGNPSNLYKDLNALYAKTFKAGELETDEQVIALVTQSVGKKVRINVQYVNKGKGYSKITSISPAGQAGRIQRDNTAPEAPEAPSEAAASFDDDDIPF